MVGNEHKYHQTPGKLRHQISRGAPDAKQADEVGNDAGHKNRAHQRNVAVKFRPHVAPDEIHQGGVDHLRHRLLPGDAGDLQIGSQPDAQGGNDEHHQPGYRQGLGDLHRAEDGNVFKGCQNSRAVD